GLFGPGGDGERDVGGDGGGRAGGEHAGERCGGGAGAGAGRHPGGRAGGSGGGGVGGRVEGAARGSGAPPGHGGGGTAEGCGPVRGRADGGALGSVSRRRRRAGDVRGPGAGAAGVRRRGGGYGERGEAAVKIVIQNSARVWGGNEKWSWQLARGLHARGHHVIVSCPSGSPVWRRAEAAGLEVTSVRPGGDLDAVSALRFASFLERESPGALLLTNWGKLCWGGWAARRAGVGRVVVRLGIVRRPPRRGPTRFALGRYVDAMIVNAPEIRDLWVREAPWFALDAVHVILNAIEASP